MYRFLQVNHCIKESSIAIKRNDGEVKKEGKILCICHVGKEKLWLSFEIISRKMVGNKEMGKGNSSASIRVNF